MEKLYMDAKKDDKRLARKIHSIFKKYVAYENLISGCFNMDDAADDLYDMLIDVIHGTNAINADNDDVLAIERIFIEEENSIYAEHGIISENDVSYETLTDAERKQNEIDEHELLESIENAVTSRISYLSELIISFRFLTYGNDYKSNMTSKEKKDWIKKHIGVPVKTTDIYESIEAMQKSIMNMQNELSSMYDREVSVIIEADRIILDNYSYYYGKILKLYEEAETVITSAVINSMTETVGSADYGLEKLLTEIMEALKVDIEVVKLVEYAEKLEIYEDYVHNVDDFYYLQNFYESVRKKLDDDILHYHDKAEYLVERVSATVSSMERDIIDYDDDYDELIDRKVEKLEKIADILDILY